MTDSEYTPTTEDVRGWYAGARYVFGDPDRQHPDMEDEFNRWLAAHDAEVRAQVSQEDPETQGWRMVYIERHNVRAAYERAIAAEKDRDELARQLAEVRAGVVAEEPEGRRWFTAAYRAQNGNVIPIGSETVIREHAQVIVDEFSREDDEGPDYFLASRIDPPWVEVTDA